MKLRRAPLFSRVALVVITTVFPAEQIVAQNPPRLEASNDGSALNGALTELQSQVHELKDLVMQLKQETTASRAEISRLRQELEAERVHDPASSGPISAADPSVAIPTGSTTQQMEAQLGHLQEDEQLLSAKVDEQAMTKVESASKYRVRFSGIVLFNLFGNQGSVDSQDVPAWAVKATPFSSSGSVGGTLRQSILGFEVFGPTIMGAHSSGALNFDFGGGFPYTSNGVNTGLVRLRTATLRLDWKNTDVVVGQDQLFFAPLTPTSFASLTVPALAYAGDLWAWTPQVRVEHRFTLSENSTLAVQGGILDPLTGESPYRQYTWYRTPQAGERSRQPAYAARTAYSHSILGHTLTVGAAGYYSRQNWGYSRMVNGWAGMADWSLPLNEWFTISGSFYRGAAIGGLGGGIGQSVLSSGLLNDPSTLIEPLNAVGGWAQLKYRLNAKLEFNTAFGQDNPFASEVRAFNEAHGYGDLALTRNQGMFGNVIYRPRSNLLFSAEYRRLKTFSLYNYGADAGQVNLAMGIAF